MLQVCFSTEKPDTILFEEHEKTNFVWLRKNIEEEEIETEKEKSIQFKFDEVYFETGANKEEIEKDFETYFEVGSKWEEVKPQSTDERLSALEDVIIALLG